MILLTTSYTQGETFLSVSLESTTLTTYSMEEVQPEKCGTSATRKEKCIMKKIQHEEVQHQKMEHKKVSMSKKCNLKRMYPGKMHKNSAL